MVVELLNMWNVLLCSELYSDHKLYNWNESIPFSELVTCGFKLQRSCPLGLPLPLPLYKLRASGDASTVLSQDESLLPLGHTLHRESEKSALIRETGSKVRINRCVFTSGCSICTVYLCVVGHILHFVVHVNSKFLSGLESVFVMLFHTWLDCNKTQTLLFQTISRDLKDNLPYL